MTTRDLNHLVSPGDSVPDVVDAIVEIPTGSKGKYEVDKTAGLLRLDRVLFSSVHYPANYGFIPKTFCDDGDPLDILVLSQIPIQPLCLVEAKPIGVMRMIDQGKHDDKIIAVANGDMSVRHFNDLPNLPEHLLLELRRFFEDYKKLENKHVSVERFEHRPVAIAVINEALALYAKTFPGKTA